MELNSTWLKFYYPQKITKIYLGLLFCHVTVTFCICNIKPSKKIFITYEFNEIPKIFNNPDTF